MSEDGTILGAFVAWGITVAVGCGLAWLVFGEITVPTVLVVAAIAITCLPPSLNPAIQIKLNLKKDASDD